MVVHFQFYYCQVFVKCSCWEVHVHVYAHVHMDVFVDGVMKQFQNCHMLIFLFCFGGLMKQLQYVEYLGFFFIRCDSVELFTVFKSAIGIHVDL